jgi:formylglycine-generating enzyme required for sulfatase activity
MQQLTFMEEFEKKFQEALGKILGSEGRLVVFVDDLDRCLPEKAVEILEAIKLFLNVPQTIFVLGMDREIVCRGIESHYWSMFQPKENEQSLDLPVDGDSYLHKLIQLPFNLPLLDEKARLKYIGTLNDESRMNLDVITRQVFARGLLPNPRQVKRALNIFNLLRKIAEAQEKQNLIPQKSIAWPLLAKTVLIQSQWPELYSKWCQIPTLVQELEKEYGKKPLTVREQFYGPTDEALTGTLGTSRTEETLKRITVSRLPEDVFLADFINNRQKYALLNELINFPKETGKGQKRARFSGLTDSELRRYLGLVGTSEEKPIKPREISLPPDISSMLQSGDPAFLREALSLIQEQEKNKNGALHQMVKQILLQNATNPELVPSVRASAADALDGIGYFPDDLFQFMQIPKEGEPPFWIARYPVTNIQYERFLEAPDFSEIEFWMNFSKYDEKNRLMDENWGDKGYTWLKENMNKMKVVYPYAWQDQRFGISRKGVPVVGISWFEANAYARWLQHHWNELVEGKNNPEIKFEKIHLPTEAEWVLAAGGEENGRYPWDEKAEPAINDKNVKVVLSNSNTFESGIQRTTPVWMNPLGVSPHGVMDMCGNVWEWQANHDREDSKALALRGGSWLINQGGARVVDRHDSSPSSRYDIIGFRVVCLPS